MTKMNLTLFVLMMSLFTLTGCPGSDSGNGNPTPYSDPFECANQQVPVGVHGNVDCPYQGEITPDGKLQPYAIHYSGSVGVGFYIDFGWDYEDQCPQDGQLPVFQNGQFSHCSDVNPAYPRTDFGSGHRANNMGECAGEQYNMNLTGCRPNLNPSQPQYNW